MVLTSVLPSLALGEPLLSLGRSVSAWSFLPSLAFCGCWVERKSRSLGFLRALTGTVEPGSGNLCCSQLGRPWEKDRALPSRVHAGGRLSERHASSAG